MKTTIAIAALVAAAGAAGAQTFSSTAFDSQTIQSGGPRDGGAVPYFHNVEGSSNGSFASHGASDYGMGGSGFSASDDLDSLSFSIGQSNAGFTTNGTLNFWVASASNSMFDLSYNGDNPNAAGSGYQDLAFVGTGTFIEVADGFVDVFTFDFDSVALDGSAAENMIEAALLSGDSLRWVITAGDPSTAATWGGIGNFDVDNPALPQLSGEYSAVPAPASAALLGLGGFVAARRRR